MVSEGMLLPIFKGGTVRLHSHHFIQISTTLLASFSTIPEVEDPSGAC